MLLLHSKTLATPPFKKKKILSEAHKEKLRQWNLQHNWKPPIIKGEKSHLWKGGKKIDKSGYLLLYKPGHIMARKDGYVPEHRFVMSQKLNRILLPYELVHHINHNKRDNRPENLELHESVSSHKKIHCTPKDPLTGKFC